jgi:transposase
MPKTLPATPLVGTVTDPQITTHNKMILVSRHNFAKKARSSPRVTPKWQSARNLLGSRSAGQKPDTGDSSGGGLMPKKARRFSREVKLTAVQRMLARENVVALARELNVLRKDLYRWRASFLSGGPSALRGPGRPRESVDAQPADAATATSRAALMRAHRRIAELERKVKRQQMELKLIRQALRQVRADRRLREAPTASSAPIQR